MSNPDSGGTTWTDPPSASSAAAGPAAEASKGKPPAHVVERVQFVPALRFVMSHADWFKNLFLFGLCLLIPVVGALVQFGYTYEITELQHRRPGTSYSQFDFNRFAVYVTRGVWAFVVFFIVQTIVIIIYQVLFQGTMFGMMALVQVDQEVGTIVAAVVIPTVIIGFFLFVLALGLVFRPLMLRAGLTQDFALTCKFKWLGDFLRKMWLETLLVNLFTITLSLLLTPFILATCCIGGIFTAGFVAIAGAHLDWQLYELYLARGGEPIPLKPLPADVPPVVM